MTPDFNSGNIILSDNHYQHSNLMEDSIYSAISLKVAATGTSSKYGTGNALTPCIDTTGYNFWSAELPSAEVRPGFCKEFTTLQPQLGQLDVTLSRAENAAANPEFRNTTFVSGTATDRDYYTLDSKPNGQRLTWQEAHDYDYSIFTGGVLASNKAELSALQNGEISDISLLNNTIGAWLDGTLSVTTGSVTVGNATDGLLWKWKGTTVENVFPSGSVNSPLLGIDSKGPGTTSSFPLLNGQTMRNGVTYDDLQIENGRAYVRSTQRQDFSTFEGETEFGFIASNSGEMNWVRTYVPGADRIWNYIERDNTGTWSSMTSGQTDIHY